MEMNEITGMIVDTALMIHKKLGPGLLESVYQAILAHELKKQNLSVDTEVPIPVYWDQLKMEIGFRADLIVEHEVIVEIKSVEKLQPVAKKQLLTYLRLAEKRLGLLLNFGEVLMKDGITRMANGLQEKSMDAND